MIFFFLVKVLYRYVIMSTWWVCGKFLCLNAKGKPGKKNTGWVWEWGRESWILHLCIFKSSPGTFLEDKAYLGRRLQTELSREMLSCYEVWTSCLPCVNVSGQKEVVILPNSGASWSFPEHRYCALLFTQDTGQSVG